MLSNAESDTGNGSEKIKRFRTLTTRAQKLTEEQKMHAERGKQLDEQIKQDELKYGQMLQNLLKLQRALDLKKKHIQEDKERQEQERLSYHSKTEEIRSVVARLNAIAMDEDCGSSAGTSTEQST